MWLIKWRRGLRVVEGLSRYPSREAAERQVAIWRGLFSKNVYYVERVV